MNWEMPWLRRRRVSALLLGPVHPSVPRCVPGTVTVRTAPGERKGERGCLVRYAEAGSGIGKLDARRSTRLRSGKRERERESPSCAASFPCPRLYSLCLNYSQLTT